MPKRVQIGVVTNDRVAKTRRVEIKRSSKHPIYKKYVRQRTVCYCHDEANLSALGDTVEIEESRPMSRTKRWLVKSVVEKSKLVDVAALQAARRAGHTEGRLEEISSATVG